MSAKTAVFLCMLGYISAMTGTTVFNNRPMSIFGLMLVITTGVALIKQSEVK